MYAKTGSCSTISCLTTANLKAIVENSDDSHPSIPAGLPKLKRPTIHNYARYGTALMDLGDMNNDNYGDFAVGAPYEDGVGAVYIYFGSSEWHNIAGTRYIS